jgi:hypothetical protein
MNCGLVELRKEREENMKLEKHNGHKENTET